MKALYQNLTVVLETIEDCVEKRRLLPALILLYSAIDFVASLEQGPGEGTKAAFVRWVDAHMLRALSLPCTALELYAARCGVVHSFAAESDLSRKGRVRRIFYAWGTARAEDLQKAADILNTTGSVSVHMDDVIMSFRKGLASYLDEVNADEARQEHVEKASRMWLSHLEPAPIQAFLDRYGGSSKDVK